MISRENNFDVIRVLASLQVIIIHCITHLEINSIYNTYIIKLFPGVLMFFCMSGFLIMSSFDRNPNIKKYTINRILRIFPGLHISLIFTLFLLLILDIIKITELFSVPVLTWIFAQLTFFQFWTPDVLRTWGVGTPNGSLWTIAVELQFYIILPILVLCFKKIKLIYKILVLGITLTLVNYFLPINYGLNENIIDKLVAVSFIPYFSFFLTGVIIYLFWIKIKVIFEGKAIIWLIIYLIYCFSYDLQPSYHPEGFQFLANLLLSILTISAAFTYPKLGKFLKGNDISYGLYIYHMLVINTMIHLGFSKRFEYLLITILITTILSVLSWLLIEKKALSLKNKF